MLIQRTWLIDDARYVGTLFKQIYETLNLILFKAEKF